MTSKWTAKPPTKEGFYWLWQPEGVWPGLDCIYIVKVETSDSATLVAWVPYMDYTDPVDAFDGALWLGPIPQPKPPK